MFKKGSTNEKRIQNRILSLRKKKDRPDDPFTASHADLIVDTLQEIEKSNDIDFFYSKLNKCARTIGNQLQSQWNSKKLKQSFLLSYRTTTYAFPDEDIHWIIKLIYQIIATRLYTLHKQNTPKTVSLLLKLFINEMLSFTKKEEMLELLDQWGGNNWGEKYLKNDTVPKSWSQCVDKMKASTEEIWKKELEGSNPLSTFRTYIAFRSFLLSLFLYFTYNNTFFVKTAKNLLAYIQSNAVKDEEEAEQKNSQALSNILDQSAPNMRKTLLLHIESNINTIEGWRNLLPKLSDIPWEAVFSELDTSKFDHIKQYAIGLPVKKIFIEETLYTLNVTLPKDSEYLVEKLTVLLYLQYSHDVQSEMVAMYTIMSLIDLFKLMLETETIKNMEKQPKTGLCDLDGCQKGEGKVLQCSQCKLRRYCSADCQQLDWKSGHNKRCKLFSDTRKLLM